MKEHYDSIIIGAGIGGLTAAAILANKGEKVLLLEQHSIPGGYATNFKRRKYNFDSALHVLNEFREGEFVYEAFKEAGVADKVKFLPHENVYSAFFPDIEFKPKSGDIENFKRLIREACPGEEEKVETIVAELMNNYNAILHFIATGEFSDILKKYELYTLKQFFDEHDASEKLRRLLNVQGIYYGLPPEEFSLLVWSYFIGSFHKASCSIEGGSQSLSDALVESIENNGGTFINLCTVNELLTENNVIKGVKSSKGEFTGDKVISNITPYAVTEMVGRENFSQDYLSNLDGLDVSMSCFQVYLGLDCKATDLGAAADDYEIFEYGLESMSDVYKKIDKNEVDLNSPLCTTLYSNVDKTLAPEGHSIMVLFTSLPEDGWFDLDGDDYREKKDKITNTMIDIAEKRYPGLKKHIKICEGGSPKTMHRYTSNTGGSILGFALTPEQSLLRRFPLAYPVEGLYQVGHWAMPASGYSDSILNAYLLALQLTQEKAVVAEVS